MYKKDTICVITLKARSAIVYSKINRKLICKKTQKLNQTKPKSRILYKGICLNTSTLGGSISKETFFFLNSPLSLNYASKLF